MWTIVKKEVKTYFSSPIGYIFIGLFLIMCSIFFYQDVVQTGLTNFSYMFFSVSTILTFIVPVLTMRMFAEERKNGTEQLLFTSPRSIPSIVLGKFFSASLIVVITEAFTFLYFIILLFFGKPQLSSALVTMLGFLLLAMSYISFGMFASSLTENQIIAGILTIAFFIVIWFMPYFYNSLAAFSPLFIFDNFANGVIYLKDVIFFVSFILLFILLTIIVLQRRKRVK